MLTRSLSISEERSGSSGGGRGGGGAPGTGHFHPVVVWLSMKGELEGSEGLRCAPQLPPRRFPRQVSVATHGPAGPGGSSTDVLPWSHVHGEHTHARARARVRCRFVPRY